MIINNANINMLNSDAVNIHDYLFDNLEMCYNEKSIKVSVLSSISKERTVISFHNVIGFYMTLCDFWGASPHVFSFEYVEKNNSKIISNLFNEINENNYFAHSLKHEEDYIETVINLASGDCLYVACEYIEIRRINIEKTGDGSLC